MSGPTPPELSPRRMPLGLLGMLTLVAVVELTIAARRLDFTTVWADDWRCTAEAATRRVKGRDVLCFGDSLVKFAVLPKHIEAKTGLRSYNLAVNAGTMPSAYFLLRRALESGAKPKAIVADFCSLMQPDKPRSSIRLYPDLATTRDCIDLATTSGDLGFLEAVLLGKLLPSYKCRFEIRQSIAAALDGRRASPWPNQAAIWATWKAQDGAQPSPGNPNRPESPPKIVGDLSPERWECDPINATYFERFLDLASSRGIPVFWVMPPLGPEVQSRRALKGSDAAYDRFAQATLGSHPDVIVLDARHSGYDASVYIDAIHLDRRGAKILTNDLATLLADRLKGGALASRWVALPAFAGRTEEVAHAGQTGKSSR